MSLLEKNIKVWDASCVNDTNDYVYLKLESMEDEVILVMCDKQGVWHRNKGNAILVLDFEYKIVSIMPGVNDKLPLKKDLYDAVLVVDADEVRDLHYKTKIKQSILDELVAEASNNTIQGQTIN